MHSLSSEEFRVDDGCTKHRTPVDRVDVLCWLGSRNTNPWPLQIDYGFGYVLKNVLKNYVLHIENGMTLQQVRRSLLDVPKEFWLGLFLKFTLFAFLW